MRDHWFKVEMRRREAEYTNYENLKLFIGSWNINGKKGDDNILPWLIKGCKTSTPEVNSDIR